MSGHVFHPGHHELHGVTVLVRTVDGALLVGRFDNEVPAGVRLLAVNRYDPARNGAPEEYLARLHQFGIPVDEPMVIVPKQSVETITPFRDTMKAQGR